MPVVDLFTRSSDFALSISECDVCIIGSGPAGSTIALELSGTGMRVVLLESGGFTRNPDVDSLNEIENVGRSRAEQWSVRNRIVGGSSHTWGGRCAAFDEIDFEERSWVPESGWPIRLKDLTPYLDRAAPYLGLARGTDFSDEQFWDLAGRKPPATATDPAKLLPFFWQFSRDDEPAYPYEYMRFGRHLGKRLGANVTLVAGATVARINAGEYGREVRSVEFITPDGRRRSLSAPIVALCAGGIENARILLSSDDHSARGLGNERDLVGRYLMDHLRGPCGFFELAGTRNLQKLFGRYNVKGTLFRGGLRLSPAIQHSEELLNCSAWLGETLAPDDPWLSVRRVLSGKPLASDAISIAANSAFILRGLKDYFIDRNGAPRKLAELTLECMVEQRPNPDSRVTLSEQRDRFRMRIARVDWRSHDDESRSMRRMAELVAEQFNRLGLPAPVLADWVRAKANIPLDFVDVAHPTATTRMSDDPSRGVVDASCQVHGVAGLYVAGSSVFPTVGHCNPTQMIVALALRLADTLKLRVKTRSSLPLRSSVASSRHQPRVLVTGGTGRIGRVLVADLLERGYSVRATTSKAPPEPGAHGDRLEWRRFDFLEAADYDGLVAGCDAVLHLAAEIGKKARMPHVNVGATQRLATAAEGAGVKSFCYTSSVAVYGSGLARNISEDSPVLTVDEDVPSEYWALDYVRMYARTKLAGEHALRENAKTVRYTVLRPAVVVSIDDLIGIRNWGLVKRTLAAHRHAHHVYVGDVSDAIIWSMERALDGVGSPGGIEVFNLSEDESPDPRHADFMRKAFEVTRDARYRVVSAPWVGDWLHDFLRFRTLPLRNPLWRMRFSNDRLRAAGYYPRFGMAVAQARALEELKSEQSR